MSRHRVFDICNQKVYIFLSISILILCGVLLYTSSRPYKEAFGMSYQDLVNVFNSAPNPMIGQALVESLVKQAQKENEAQLKAIQEAQLAAIKAMEEAIQLEKDRIDATYHYQRWVGYVFANPEKNSLALDDFKRRAFQSECLFIRNWSDFNPRTPTSFVPATTADEANASYHKFLIYLTYPNGAATPLLNDARERFFTNTCGFKNPTNKYSYAKNFSPVFK